MGVEEEEEDEKEGKHLSKLHYSRARCNAVKPI